MMMVQLETMLPLPPTKTSHAALLVKKEVTETIERDADITLMNVVQLVVGPQLVVLP